MSIFPYYNDPDEDFFDSRWDNFIKKKFTSTRGGTNSGQDNIEEAVKALSDFQILKPQRERKTAGSI